MKRPEMRRLVIVGVIVLAASAILLFWMRDVVREVVVIPISYLAWLIGIFLQSTSQLFFWLALLLIALWGASRSLRAKKKRVDDTQDYRPVREELTSNVGKGRVGYWALRVNYLRMGAYYQGSFNESLGRLLLDLLSYRHRMTNRQIEQALDRGTLNVPPEVREFVRKSLWGREIQSTNLFAIFWRNLRLWFLSKFRKDMAESENSEIDPSVRRVIQYMEEELEVSYDSSGR